MVPLSIVQRLRTRMWIHIMEDLENNIYDMDNDIGNLSDMIKQMEEAIWSLRSPERVWTPVSALFKTQSMVLRRILSAYKRIPLLRTCRSVKKMRFGELLKVMGYNEKARVSI
jgi:hypothetical protein